MSELNQYALSQQLGSRMKPIAVPEFGNFGLLAVTAESLKAREVFDAVRSSTGFSYAHDAQIARAFEDVRDGHAPDCLLWNRDLLLRFAEQCKRHGITADNATLARRILNIRKNVKRYERHGIRLSPTTKEDPPPTLSGEALLLIEFALVRIRYRYGLAIDEMLLNLCVCDEFERMVHEVAPNLAAEHLRLGALRIRKTQFIKTGERSLIDQLDLQALDRVMSTPCSLSQLRVTEIPSQPGLIELFEKKRYLYIGAIEDIQASARSFAQGRAFQIVAGAFWHPTPDDIFVQYSPGERIAGTSAERWALRLIAERHPLLNWPVGRTVA